MEQEKIVVLGTGAWGTTFAKVLADGGQDVVMWGRRQQVVDLINDHENSAYLPGIILPEGITATTDMKAAVEGADLVVLAVPTQVTGQVVKEAVKYAPDATYVSLSKGIEGGTHRTISQIMADEGGLTDSQIAVISGPNLSREIALEQPAATVVASRDVETAKRIAKLCHSGYFRPYVSTDVTGVEIAGATKNVFALAIGAADGLGLGINTKSTLITRGLAEMTRFGTALGADPTTFAGIAGIGDLVATCSSTLSRNYTLGNRLGQGMTLEEAVSLSPGVAEGPKTAVPVLQMAQSLDVDMPITQAVVEVISGRASIDQMGEMLLGRPQKMDGWEIQLLD